jgi:hypothetical protein
MKGDQWLPVFYQSPDGNAADMYVEGNVIHFLAIQCSPVQQGLIGRRVRQD